MRSSNLNQIDILMNNNRFSTLGNCASILSISFLFLWFNTFRTPLTRRLHTGWSSVKPQGPLNNKERNAIIEVVKRNELLESAERYRVGRLVERVEKIKLRAADCGPRFCR